MEKKKNRQIIKGLFEPIQYTKGRWRVYFFTQVLDVFESIFVIQVGVYIISAIERKDIGDIRFWCIILGITFLVYYIIARISEQTDLTINTLAAVGLRKKYFTTYVHLDNTKIEALGTGKMQNIMLQGINSFVVVSNAILPAIIVQIGAIIYAFILIANRAPNWKYFVGFLGLFLISTALMRLGLSRIKDTRKKGKEVTMDIDRNDIKIIMSKFEILQNNKLSQEMEKQEILLKKRMKIRQRGDTIKSIRQTAATMIINGMQIRIYIAAGIGIVTGHYTFAYLMLLLQLLDIMSRYVWEIRSNLKDYYNNIIHIEKLQETFTSIPRMKIEKDKEDFVYKYGDIDLQKIFFSYNKSSVFQNFNLKIKGGDRTAFVGESGGGKTTLIKLLAGYINSDEGEIIIDGQRLSKIRLMNYYRHIGYLSQEPSVFDGTIYENLVYALDKDPPNEEIQKVLNDAKCEFILEFEKGLETEIGERGVRLSGGQKQRLAIAKIMLKNPNIILLDEPTSALDSFNEELVNIALHNLFKGKTVIVVAHRLQTVKTANRILLFEQGKILEDGTHDELIKLNGKYRRMLDLQSGF